MLTYIFKKGNIPLYQQAYQFIRDDIISGALKVDEKLPSKRTFAENNGISTITIQNAYDRLISEGYVYAVPSKGYYVAKIEKPTTIPRRTDISLNIKLPEPPAKYEIDLSDNRIDPKNFPFSVWAKLSRGVISGKSKELMEISPACGIYDLRKAIACHLQSFRGMLVDPNQIIVGAGTEYLYGLLIRLLGADKSYCIENPGYKKLVKIYSQYNIGCKLADLDDYGVSAEALDGSEADIAHICPNHHFPTGITMPASRRYEILGWANKTEGRYIIEDDYDSEFRTVGRPLPTLFSMDSFGKVIYMNTFSKSLSPTIRISYMVLPVHLINRFYREMSFCSCTVSNFEQYTLAEFISRGYFEKHINRMRLYYGKVRKSIIDCFRQSELSSCSKILDNESGLHFLLKINTELSEEELGERLIAKGIHLQKLSDYYMKSEKVKEHHYIINYSGTDVGKLSRAFTDIYECCGGALQNC